jgi:hypothetical protein
MTMVFIKMCSEARFDKKERAEAGCPDNGFLMSPDNITRLQWAIFPRLPISWKSSGRF